MIFLDTNMFLRYLVAPSPDNPNGERHQAVATGLFTAVADGQEEVTTTEVVLHEVCYLLSSPRMYRVPVPKIVEMMTDIIRLPGFNMPRGEKRLILRAFEIYLDHPRLEFSHSLIAARAERLKIPLATFDEALGRLPFITRWWPPSDD